MTNAEKYLKDGVSIEKSAKVIKSYYYNSPFESELEAVESFLKAPVQPTLTEDERVILQGLKIMGIEKISRDKENDICFHYSSANRYGELGEKFAKLNLYFQFIKERRRI